MKAGELAISRAGEVAWRIIMTWIFVAFSIGTGTVSVTGPSGLNSIYVV